MSDNERVHLVVSKKKGDARVRRTRDSLGDALIALMQEKSFDTITVQDVLDRACVSHPLRWTNCFIAWCGREYPQITRNLRNLRIVSLSYYGSNLLESLSRFFT